MEKRNLYITGGVGFTSNLEILEIGKVLSKYLFNAVPFTGLERNIYDEVPAVYLAEEVLGFYIVLQGKPTNVEDGTYYLEFMQYFDFEIDADAESVHLRLDDYFFQLLKCKVPKEYYEDLEDNSNV